MKPGCTSVSRTSEFSAPPACQKRMPSSSMSKSPPIFRKTLRNGIIACCWRRGRRCRPWWRAPRRPRTPASIRSGIGQVVVASETVDAVDLDDPVGLDADDRAHLLQDRDEVEDLRLDGGVAQLGDALGAHRGQQHLLGGADAGVGQLDAGALEAVGGGQAQPLRTLLHVGAELAQDVEVVVDRALTDATATEVGDERLTQAVQQRPAQQHRHPRRTGVRVDVRHVRLLDVGGVEQQLTVAVGRVDLDPVQLQQARHDLDVGDLGDTSKSAWPLRQQRGHHGFGDQVLRHP